jgi:hypothetical protein
MNWRTGVAMPLAAVLASAGLALAGAAPAEAIDLCPYEPGDTIVGGPRDNVLFGTARDDTIYGGPGNDTIYGGGGNDTVFGGPGADTVHGGPCNDFLFGDDGFNGVAPKGDNGDDLFGGEGNDELVGDQGVDTGDGGAGTNHCDVENPATDVGNTDEPFSYAQYFWYSGPRCGDEVLN